MEEEIHSECQCFLNEATMALDKPIPLQALAQARSLIVNPSTSEATISSLFQTLCHSLQTYHHPLSLCHILSLLAAIVSHHPALSHSIFHAICSFSLHLHNTSARTVANALSVLASIAESDQTLVSSLAELSEGTFLSLCFQTNVPVRHWLLLNATRLQVRPHLLLMLLLGFTKDPYPYVRGVALDGLVALCKSSVVGDRALLESCYCCAVELLYDMEDSVRSAAVRAVSQWGQLLVASNDNNNRDWSDSLFVQICSMVIDMSMKVRIEAFNALGAFSMVSEAILVQTLSKKVLSTMKEKTYPSLSSLKLVEMPASSVAGAFVHGLEDEFYEVRRSACYALQQLSILSADFAGEALNLVLNVLNDDSMVVRIQALEAMCCMVLFDHLKVQETHMHMFLSTLIDTDASVRSAARKVLQVAKLNDITTFKLAIDSLLENLETYPQDEAAIFSVLFSIGQCHGNFVVGIIERVSDEIERSSNGNLGFDSGRVAALLVLAIAVPLSHEERTPSIPRTIFSYAVTLLGRISHALGNVVDQNTLLAYLSHCSSSTVVSPAEFYFKKEMPSLVLMKCNLSRAMLVMSNNANEELPSPAEMQLQDLNVSVSGIHFQRTSAPIKLPATLVDQQSEVQNDLIKLLELVLEKLKVMWQLIQLGCTGEVLKTLRSWKEQLAKCTSGSSTGVLDFVSQCMRVVKLLAKIWPRINSPRKLSYARTGDLGLLLEKLDRILKGLSYRFIGMSKQEELFVLELILVHYMLRLATVEACNDLTTFGKLFSTLPRVELIYEEMAVEPSDFVSELKSLLHEIGSPTDGPFYSPSMFQKSVKIFSLKQFIFCGELKYIKAELDIPNNDIESPFHFVSGLPVGIQLEITLYNISRENRLWLRLVVDAVLTEFVFLDLGQYEGNNEIRKFTFLSPFYRTPKANSFTVRVCLGMECLSEDSHLFGSSGGGPKKDLVYLCKEKEVCFSQCVRKSEL
ncbi:protein SIEL isoform X1 [Diospyros lotus]|uniref:protein SIEL isoform X1 n=1 Tax=Diospyros lotus TaxID=55363 RepID=UPI002251F7A3|nr:protein SIEL isoform X1 [Diospyros lotus]